MLVGLGEGFDLAGVMRAVDLAEQQHYGPVSRPRFCKHLDAASPLFSSNNQGSAGPGTTQAEKQEELGLSAR